VLTLSKRKRLNIFSHTYLPLPAGFCFEIRFIQNPDFPALKIHVLKLQVYNLSQSHVGMNRNTMTVCSTEFMEFAISRLIWISENMFNPCSGTSSCLAFLIGLTPDIRWTRNLTRAQESFQFILVPGYIINPRRNRSRILAALDFSFY